jgi:syntaxin 1B/2/3
MQEFSKIVQQQESSVGYIEQNGERTHKNVEGAKEYLGKANENARSRNRAKWWCLIILLLVVIAVAIIVVIIITRARATKA